MPRLRRRTALCPSLALSLVAACGLQDLGEEEERTIGAVDCQIDDSYGADTAVDIAPGGVVTGTICPAGFDDRDFYRVTTGPGDRILEIHLFNDTVYTNVDLRAALLAADGTPTPLAASSSSVPGTATDIRAAFEVAPDTVYIIEVSDAGGDDGDPANPYSLEIVLAAEPDGNEGNDSADSATSGACGGQSVAGYLATRGDQDYFRCSAQARPARLKLLFEAAADLGWQPRITVLNEQGQPMLDADVAPDADGAYRLVSAVSLTEYVADTANPLRSETLSRAGDFIVLVEDGAPEGEAAVDYNFDPTSGRYQLTLEIDSGPGGDTEPADRNDAPGSAIVLSGSQSISGYFATAGDVDWYRVDGQAGNNILEIEVTLPGDGLIPAGVDPDRVGVDVMIYDARLLAQGGGSTSVTTGCTESPTFANELAPCDNFNPGSDQCRGAHGDQQPVCLPGAYCGELRHSKLILQGADAAGTPQAASYRTAVAVRKSFPVFIKLAQFQSAVFHEGRPYTLRVSRRADADGDEPNDLPPNLNFQGRYSSGSDAIRSCNRSAFSARNIGSSSSCGGSFSASGVLSYIGDRDYFTFNLPPGEVEVNIDVSSSGVSSTPVELGLFVFTGGSHLHGSFVDANTVRASVDQACSSDADCCLGSMYECDYDERPCIDGQCSASRSCVAHNECPDQHLCVAERCFRDDDAHSPPSLTFGPDGGNCLMARPCSDGNPWLIEVTDNGLNDYDADMRYTLTVRHSCNCPDRCSFCRAPDDYRACSNFTRQ